MLKSRIIKIYPEENANQFLESGNSLLNLLLPFFSLLVLTYILWRYFFTANWLIWFIVPLFLCELYNAFNTIFFLITTRKVAFPLWRPPVKNKTVDIFIPTYNEPQDIVEMTTIGALNVVGVNKVFVLDDGNRTNIKQMASDLGVIYLARGENSHAKAGNLNYGLKHSRSDFIITLDCDHVPQPNFIERTLGYFNDERLAFIQTPQVFYNPDSIQHRKTENRNLWNEQTMFYESIQPGKNKFNAAFFCGTGAMIRRQALDQVDGFATGTATEDIHTSLRLHAKGWRSLFLNEVLATGLAAEDLKEYHKQRVRWGAGSLGLLFRSPDSPLWAKGLTLMQRLCYFNSTTAYLEGSLKLLYFTVPIYVILTHSALLALDLISFLLIYIPYLLISFFVTFLFSRRTYHFPLTEQFNIINIFSHLEAIKGIFKIQKKFGVSVKVKNFKQSSIIFPGLIFISVIMIGTNIYGFYYLFYTNQLSELISNYIWIGLFWNSFNLFFVLAAIFYLISFNNKEKLTHKFLVNQEIKSFGIRGKVFLKSISLKGATLLLTSAPNDTFKLDLRSLGLNLKLDVFPESIKQKKGGLYFVDVSFKNLNLEKKRQLTLYFFNTLVPKLFEEDFIIKEEKTLKLVRSSFEEEQIAENTDTPSLDYLKQPVPAIVSSQSSL